MKASVGKSTVFFTIVLLLSSNAFLARILDNEKAEILGPLAIGASIFGVEITGFTGVSTETVEVSTVFTRGGALVTFGSSTIE